tara:strand:- start:4 stop:267 length:264 start_codon:yes stop_codon:yes gene_type:complete
MAMKGSTPKKGSSRWVKNEKLIAKNPILRAARDKSEGFKPGSGISTGPNDEQYKQGYDQINWGNKDNSKRSYKLKVNGVEVDPNEEE